MHNGGDMNSSHPHFARPLGIVFAIAGLLTFVSTLEAAPSQDEEAEAEERFKNAFETITEDEVRRHVNYLASPELEGRDTPSRGLDLAAEYIAGHFRTLGLEGAGPEGEFIVPWTYPRELETPVAVGCLLEVEPKGKEITEFVLGHDFTPLPGANGDAEGDVSFLGFGIHAPKDKYDDLKGGKMKGKVAMFFWEEPRHKRVLDGPEISEAANIFTKLKDLKEEGVIGAIVVRRLAADNAVDSKGKLIKGGIPDEELVIPPNVASGEESSDEPELDFGFHHTWAKWNATRQDRVEKAAIPAIEVTPEAASLILGEDVIELAEKMDKSGKSVRKHPKNRVVRFSAQTEERSLPAPNVIGVLRGNDPELAEQYVILGAHMDHLGMDFRGRLAAGADDNASGVSAILELAEAMVQAKPRRSFIFATFSGEEDGLLGSKAMCENPPIPVERWIAMLNMDMIGRGSDSESIVLGVKQNPDLGKVLTRAKKLEKSGIKKIETKKGDELWQRSDHYSFHSVGVPVLFFFEALPITKNHDYHTWRDTPDGVDIAKVANTTKLIFNMAWLLGQDDAVPDAPRH
jgi:hypothetical protein